MSRPSATFDRMSDASGATSQAYVCRGCGQQVAAPADPSRNILLCPSCGREFFIGEDDAGNESDSASPSQNESEAEFDALRIRQMVMLRRGINRSRAYAVIAAVVCAAGAVQSGWLVWLHLRAGNWELRLALFILLMVIAIVASLWFAQRAKALHRQMRASHLPEPTTPPDFSSLGDGSQRARNLNDIG